MTVARLGVMRLGATRLNHYQPWFKVYVNGIERGTANTRIEGASITQLLNHEPDTMQLRVFGFTPVKGHEIKVYCGDTDLAHQLFGGHILNVKTTYEADDPANVVYDVDCIDYTWLLNRRKVLKKYTNQSADAIVLDLMSTYTTGFTTVHVVSGLATIDEITFTNEDVSDALTRLAERIGGYWYAEYGKDLHFFLTESETAGPITQAEPRGAVDFVQSVDLSQVVTRVTGAGGGSVAATDCAVGQTAIPVEDAARFSVSGGTVQSGPQAITYTGVAGTAEAGAITGFVLPPTSAHLSYTPGNGVVAGTNLTAGTYWIGASNVTAEGETGIGALAQVTLTGAHNEIFVTRVSVPTDTKVTGLRFYIGTNGGAQSTLKAWVTASGAGEPTTNSWTSTFFEIKAANAANRGPLTTNTAGVSAEGTPAGTTSLQVDDLSVFASSGWAEAPGGQVFSYTGRSASSGAGSLTGIPSSGVGALTAPVRSGTIKSLPQLTGIPASGAGSILYAINKGDEVNIRTERNDTAAQTAMAGFVGGDGIHIEHISDGRLSLTELNARGDAVLAERKDPNTTVSFQTRDQTQQVGRTVTFTLTSPAVSGTHKIQRVTLSELAISGGRATVFPLRSVECSSKRFSFEDLLRQIKGRAN